MGTNRPIVNARDVGSMIPVRVPLYDKNNKAVNRAKPDGSISGAINLRYDDLVGQTVFAVVKTSPDTYAKEWATVLGEKDGRIVVRIGEIMYGLRKNSTKLYTEECRWRCSRPIR